MLPHESTGSCRSASASGNSGLLTGRKHVTLQRSNDADACNEAAC
jgi:hypothetical protein